jgi:predicted RNA-binding protein YlqC (UPF0109 family)
MMNRLFDFLTNQVYIVCHGLVNRLVSRINIHQFSFLNFTNMERVTYKIEIPFTDHAHCIGRQGNQIQSIMSATDTHIHFPDGNREPNGTKSNQV